MGFSCCVVNCKNTSINSKCKFYRFPTAKYKVEQRNKWIAAVRRQNIDGSSWSPKPHNLICSDHFVGGKKSEEQLSPSYLPTIFPPIYKTKTIQESERINRYKRLRDRRNTVEPLLQITMPTTDINVGDTKNMEILKTDQGCQANIFDYSNVSEGKTFICNRLVTRKLCEAETEISENTKNVTIQNQIRFRDKKCGTPCKTFMDQLTQTDTIHFTGYSSIQNDEQLLELTGVTKGNFNFLLKRTSSSNKCIISREDRLFIFLVKMKTGLTFSAISVIFGIHRATISRIFFSILEDLATSTANLVFWPNRNAVQATMPEYFYRSSNNTRVIIDCTEFKIEVPADVDNRVYCYSHCKNSFTAKLLIGVTPGGLISFKSKVASGRTINSQMAIESGLIDSLEDGDVVLADKGFPEIKAVFDKNNRKIMMVMPPFLENKEFSEGETKETDNVAGVRIHVERIIQKLKVYQVLNKIPENLFHCVDDIVHICCVLVNLQPSISTYKPN